MARSSRVPARDSLTIRIPVCGWAFQALANEPRTGEDDVVDYGMEMRRRWRGG